jgi:polyhydroxyalkanoate synthase
MAPPLEDASSSIDPAGVERVQRLLGEVADFLDWLRARYFDGSTHRPPEVPADSPFSGQTFVQTARVLLARVLSDPAALARHCASFANLALSAAKQELNLEPEPGDRRFKDPLWHTSPVHRTLLQLYLGWQQSLGAWVAEQKLSPADEQRVRFVFEQLVAALAPSNLPLNPSALKRATTTEGNSVVQGMKQWVDDVLHNGAMPKQIRPDAFRVGEDLAITPGAVVYRHELFELLQYDAATPTVHRRPLLIVPPQINRFYIFDLQPANSMLRYLVQQGFQVFCLSWRNPDASFRASGLESYVHATLQAVEIARSIARSASIGLISACAGGLTALASMGLLAMQRQRVVSHHSLLVTSPLPDTSSLLASLIDRESLYVSTGWSQQRGVMDGEQLARIFAWLRPQDLVWNYWVNNYLLGRHPPALDVLYWDNDSTQLTAALHRDFIDMVDQRVFERPGALTLGGKSIDFRRLRVSSYFVGGRDDYLTSWHSVYRAVRHFPGRHSFILSASGHVQSLLRPPRLTRCEYFVRSDFPAEPDEWLAGAQRRDGSWWPHWSAWLAEHSGTKIKARHDVGSAAFPPLGPAPGEYVRAH